MADAARARFQIGIEFQPGLIARLADAETFVLAQATLTVIAHQLRASAWRGALVIVRLADGVVVERLLIAGVPD